MESEDVNVNVEIKDDSFIVVRNGASFTKVSSIEQVPAGSLVFASVEDLMDMKKDELEEVYASLVGTAPKSFKNKKAAVDNIVYQFSSLPVTKQEEKVEKPAGKRKYERKSDDVFVVLPLNDANRALYRTLPPQARALYDMMKGKDEYAEDDLRALVEKNKANLRTKQDPWRIFKYYQGPLTSADLLRRK